MIISLIYIQVGEVGENIEQVLNEGLSLCKYPIPSAV